jgi:hypothetical protein
MAKFNIYGVAPDQRGNAVLVRVNNVADVVQQQGQLASLARALAPQTIEAKVYSTLAAKLKASLAEAGVDADVNVVNPAGYVPAKSDLVRDVFVGVLGATVFAGITYGVKRWRKRK